MAALADPDHDLCIADANLHSIVEAALGAVPLYHLVCSVKGRCFN